MHAARTIDCDEQDLPPSIAHALYIKRVVLLAAPEAHGLPVLEDGGTANCHQDPVHPPTMPLRTGTHCLTMKPLAVDARSPGRVENTIG